MCYIKLDKKLLDWEWFDDLPTLKLWLYILLNANIEDKEWHGTTIEKGTLITSVKHISEQTNLSVMQVRNSLKKLSITNEITIKTTNKNTQIIVNKWDFFQGSASKDNKQNNKQNNKQITTTKEYINIKENINNINIINKKESFGEYKNVLLTLDERQKLQDKFGYSYSERLIKYLDEYIEMKGYKAKSHYLAILKWVDDAMSRDESKPKVKVEYSNPIPNYQANNQTIDTSSLDEWRKK